MEFTCVIQMLYKLNYITADVLTMIIGIIIQKKKLATIITNT